MLQVEHEQLKTKIKEARKKLFVKRKEYTELRIFEWKLALRTLETLKEKLHERTERLAQLKIKVL